MEYAGIGSREAPYDVELESTIQQIVEYCESLGLTMVSGGAPNMDTRFEKYIKNPSKKKIYLPWKGFNGNKSTLFEPSPEAFEIAAKFHPAWNRLTTPVRKLMARNTHQVLGGDCNSPIIFIVCWTPGGKYQGGTSQAMRIADHYRIPIINLFNNNFEQVKEKINKAIEWKK